HGLQGGGASLMASHGWLAPCLAVIDIIQRDLPYYSRGGVVRQEQPKVPEKFCRAAWQTGRWAALPEAARSRSSGTPHGGGICYGSVRSVRRISSSSSSV